MLAAKTSDRPRHAGPHVPRSWAEKAYPKLIHYNKMPRGGHFAAWEQPELLVSEVRASFKSLH
jgi:hypothetical protein